MHEVTSIIALNQGVNETGSSPVLEEAKNEGHKRQSVLRLQVRESAICAEAIMAPLAIGPCSENTPSGGDD